MTALQFIDKNASAMAGWYARVAPHDDKVKGLWLPRESAVKARRNLANVPGGARTGVVTGSPSYSAGFASFTSFTDYVQTNEEETSAMTMVIIAKSSAAATTNSTRPTFIGNYDGTSGAMIYLTSAGASLFIRGQGYDGAGDNKFRVVDVTGTITSWAMYAFVIDATAQTIYDRTNLTSQTQAITGRTVSSKLLGLGSARSSAFTGGTCNIAGALVANVAATTTQLDDWQAMFNTELAVFGIAV
jgi:hypothetical protein